MEPKRVEELASLAAEVSKDIVRMVGVARSGPLEMPLGIVDLLVYLYWEVLLILPSMPKREDRDRFLLGIPSFSPALYAVLARRGYFDREELWHYRRLGAMLQAAPDFKRTPGADAPCISSASELYIAIPLARSLLSLAALSQRVFCLCPMGDLKDEFFIIEAKRAASEGISNLVLLIICGESEKIVQAEADITEYYKDFADYGWETSKIDGHSYLGMEKVFTDLDWDSKKPKVLFIKVQNIKKLSFMERSHKKTQLCMSIEEMDHALEELEGRENE